jgi:arylsulfatase B
MKQTTLIPFILVQLLLLPMIVMAQQNCLLIIADDVSPDYFSSFSTITDTATTPHISGLAKNGIRFTNVWASPICSPTRAGIMTGRYSFRTGIGQVITTNTSPQLDTAEISIAKLLKSNSTLSYSTALVGKWHLNANAPNKRLYPNKLGFDFYKGNFNGAITDYYDYPIITNGLLDTAHQYATTQTVTDAINWLGSISNNKPFFMWVAFNAPHSPYHLPPSNLCNTNNLNGTTGHINANKSSYFKAAIQAMDTEIGRLLLYLKQNGLSDSTNIIFIGDNGNSADVAQNNNALHCKNTVYNYGVHVPMIISGPSVKNPNRNCNELVNTVDLFSTIADLSTIGNWKNSIPSSTKVDSKSLIHYLKNTNTVARKWMFSEQFTSPPAISDGKTIRNNQYQLIKFDNGVSEFYDLTNDLNQNTNLLSIGLTSIQETNYLMLCDTLNMLVSKTICTPIDLSENNLVNFNIFPNPSSGYVHLRCDESLIGSEISISTIIGEKLHHQILLRTSETIELDGYNSGAYIITVKKDNQSIHKKIQLIH